MAALLAAGAVAAASARRRRPDRVRALWSDSGGRAAHRRRARSGSRLADLRTDRRAPIAVVVIVALCWIVHPWFGVLVVGGGAVAAPLSARRSERRRTQEIRERLPDVIDLLRSSVDAGLTVGGAIDAVASRTDGAWQGALVDVQRRVALGERRAVALHGLDQLGDAARPLVRALISSERDGAPLTLALDALARDARLERRRDAEERARRLPVQLLFPLVLCILPAFGLLTVVPLLAGTFRSLTN